MAKYLTDRDEADLRDMLRAFRASPQSGVTNSVWEDEQTAPECYVALPPAAGIPALTRVGAGSAPSATTGDQPGSALCDIYRIINRSGTPELQPIGVQKAVHNLSESTIASDWVPVSRTKHGEWVAMTGATGGGDQVFRGVLDGALSPGGSQTAVETSPDGSGGWTWTSRREVVQPVWDIDSAVADATPVLCVRLGGLWFAFLQPCGTVGTGS